MRRIHLAHGIHTSPHSRRLFDMRNYIEAGAEMPVVYHEYGNIYGVQTRWVNPGIAERLGAEVGYGDILVGHSNGCAIWKRALDLGVPASGFVCLNAALKDDIGVPIQLRWMHVYYNRHDEIVPLTNFPVLRKIAFDPLWGDMGRDGYTGKDPRVAQWDCGARDDDLPDLEGHSSIIDPKNSKAWGVYIGHQIKLAAALTVGGDSRGWPADGS